MAKPIYCILLLLVSCSIYETYGNYNSVRHIRLPSRIISHNNGPYDSSSSSSSSTAADAVDATSPSESAAPSLSSTSPLKKLFSLNNFSGFDGNHELGQVNSKSMGNINYRQKSNDMDSDTLNNGSAQNSMTSGFLNNKPQSGLYNRNGQIDMTSENLNNKNIQNSMNSGFLNNNLLRGLYDRNNNPNDKALEDLNTMKRQKSLSSDFQGFPYLINTRMNPSASRIVRQKTFSPLSDGMPSNDDDSQRIGVGNNYPSMMNIMNSFKNALNDRKWTALNGQNIIFKPVRRCCINNECRLLRNGEECIPDDYLKNMNNEQQPNNPMTTTSSNEGDGVNAMFERLKDKKSNPFGQNSFHIFGSDLGDFQKTGSPTNMGLGSMSYPTIIPSDGSSDDNMGSYVTMPHKKKTINYSDSDPIGLSEDEVNEIRNRVLQKSNLYRRKYSLAEFTLDDQLNNCAQDWANQLAETQTFDHRPGNAYGENLYGDSDLNNLGDKAVDAWYNEITMFNIDDNESTLSFKSPIHHMTQLLWKASTKLGVGVSKTQNGMYNVVANYDPAGNVRQYFKINLPTITQENIDEAAESQKSATKSNQKSSWYSSSSSPLQSDWNNYDLY